MTRSDRLFAGQPDGTTVTVANSDDFGDPALSNVAIGAGAVLEYDDDVTFRGDETVRLVTTSGTATSMRDDVNAALLALRFTVRYATTPVVAGLRILNVVVGSTSIARIINNASNKFVVQTNNGGTGRWTSTTTITGSVDYTFAIQVSAGNSSNATLKVDLYTGEDTTPVETGFSATNLSVGATGNVTAFSIGSSSGVAATQTMNFAHVSWDDSVSAVHPMAPVSSDVPPVADAGADFSVDPNIAATFELDGSDSTDGDGTIATYLWEHQDEDGEWATVAGSGATRTVDIVPSIAGSSDVYRLTVTDDDDLSSAADTVIVTTLPHTRWMKTDDGLVPLRRRV